jgi:hypothetical protein
MSFRVSAAVSAAILIAAAGARAANAAPVFHDEIACYSALAAYSYGTTHSLLNHEAILIPAMRLGKMGFYVYTEDGAYFHAFPTAPNLRGYTYYHFELRTPGKKPDFLSYSFSPVFSSNPAIVENDAKQAAIRDYAVLSDGDAMDDASKSLFVTGLLARIGSVSSSYADHIKNAPPTAADLKIKYQAALDSCSKVENPSVKSAVTLESGRLALVNPPMAETPVPPAIDNTTNKQVGNSTSTQPNSDATPPTVQVTPPVKTAPPVKTTPPVKTPPPKK